MNTNVRVLAVLCVLLPAATAWDVGARPATVRIGTAERVSEAGDESQGIGTSWSIAPSAPAIGTTGPVDFELLGITAVAAGDRHTCALTQTGRVKCWGWYAEDIVGLSGVLAIATGGGHTCALAITGGVKCWGSNSDGQLGNGTTMGGWPPGEVVGLSDATAITAGNRHTCAITHAGGVKCWGNNYGGQLGDGTAEYQRLTPVDVVGLSAVIAVAAGGYHTCALTEEGSVKCWGVGGRLGDGTYNTSRIPVEVIGLSGITFIAADFGHTCALTQVGEVMCWGSNDSGELGDGTTVNPLVPVPVVGLSGVIAVAPGTGYGHTCAVTQTGGVKCWGSNYYGQLGDGTTISHITPGDVGDLSGVKSVTAGEGYTCALTQTGRVKCWGWNFSGQLGCGMSCPDSLTPVSVLILAFPLFLPNILR